MGGVKGLLILLVAMGYTLAPVFEWIDTLLLAGEIVREAERVQTAALPATEVLFEWRLPRTVFKVAVSSWGAGMVGAIMSLFFGQVPESRRRLFGEIFGATAFGVGFVVLVGDGMNWDWLQTNESMACLVGAGIVRWFLPPAITRVDRFIHESKINLPLLKSRAKGDEQ